MMKLVKVAICFFALALAAAQSPAFAAGHGGHGGGHTGAGSGGHGGGFNGRGGHGGFRGHGGGAVFLGAALGLGLGFGVFGAYAPGPYYYDTYPWWMGDPAAMDGAIDQGAPAGVQQGGPSWFYCDNPQGYYPYVQKCASGWQRVAPFAAPPPGFGSY